MRPIGQLIIIFNLLASFLFKIVPGNRVLYIAYGNCEHSYSNYEVLVKNDKNLELDWLPDSWGTVPNGAIPVTHGDCDTDYVARPLNEKIGGDDVIGKMVPGTKAAYFPYGGDEHKQREYLILVDVSPDFYVMSHVDYDIDRHTVATTKPRSIANVNLINRDSCLMQEVTGMLT